MVKRPLVFTVESLLRYPMVSELRFIECSGNGGGIFRPDDMPEEITPQRIDGLVSTSRRKEIQHRFNTDPDLEGPVLFTEPDSLGCDVWTK